MQNKESSSFLKSESYFASSTSSSLESITNFTNHSNNNEANKNEIYFDEPPGFHEYRKNVLDGTLATCKLTSDQCRFKYIPQPRTSYGREGRTIKLHSNHFAIQIKNDFIFRYSVDIFPDKCPKAINRQVCLLNINENRFLIN